MSVCNRIGVLALLALGLAPNLSIAAPVAYEIDPTHSAVQFAVTHLGIARITGRFERLQGEFAYDATRLERCTAHLIVATNSIDTADDERDAKLRSSDFFAVAQFPQIRFDSSSVAGTGDEFTLTGELELLGVSHPVTFQVRKTGESRDPWGGYRAGFAATATIKRSDFGMRYMLGAVGDEVAITVDIEGIRKR
jgi:polyisoprenoid-binding protein YceI